MSKKTPDMNEQMTDEINAQIKEEAETPIEPVVEEVPADKELNEQKERYLRLMAEYDNFRKRSQREKDETYLNGFVDAVTGLLPVLDSLERAVEFAPDDEGIKLLKKQAEDSLQKMGVTAIVSDGVTFDPALHNAIMHDEDAEKGESEIVQTFQKGYICQDRVIRHAVVKVVN